MRHKTGRLKFVAGDLAAGNYSGIRELQPGWLLCNGAAVPNSGVYTALYAALGTKFGAAGTLPNLLDGYLPIPKGTSWAIGARGGEYNHTLTLAEIPSHYHNLYDRGPGDDAHPSNISGYFPPWTNVQPYQAFGYGGSFPSIGTNAAGGGGSHNNLPPYHVIGCWLVRY